MTSPFVAAIQREFRRNKTLAEGTFAQLDPEELCTALGGIQNSIATLAWHISGHLTSRFTDFLTADGEKPWRKREEEFQERRVSREELLEKWETGWNRLFATLDELSDADLEATVTIRGVEQDVRYALHRTLSHTSYHVGQIVLIGKAHRGDAWTYLSIPPGKTEEYNRSPDRERELGLGSDADSSG